MLPSKSINFHKAFKFYDWYLLQSITWLRHTISLNSEYLSVKKIILWKQSVPTTLCSKINQFRFENLVITWHVYKLVDHNLSLLDYTPNACIIFGWVGNPKLKPNWKKMCTVSKKKCKDAYFLQIEFQLNLLHETKLVHIAFTPHKVQYFSSALLCILGIHTLRFKQSATRNTGK